MRKEKKIFAEEVSGRCGPLLQPTEKRNECRINQLGMPLRLGTHQTEKNRERSYIPVYTGRGPARRVMRPDGKVKYVERERR